MAVITKQAPDTFGVAFGELAKTRRGEPVVIDPFLIGRAIALVMRECSVRSAAGRPLLWNDYRVVLARRDFELVRPLQGLLERDLAGVLAHEAQARQAELVGELRVTVVYDEGDELAVGQGVVRVAFVPTQQLPAVRDNEMTVRFDSFAVAGEIAVRAPKPSDTVFVGEETGGVFVRWPGGEAVLPAGTRIVVGRPHDGAPQPFVALAGASPKISKQHAWLSATATSVRVGRPAEANPVHVNGQLIASGGDVEVALPAEIALSRGELVLIVQRV